MSRWHQELEDTCFRFLEALEQRGLVAADETILSGHVATEAGRQHIKVRLPEDFPYRPPRVHPDEQFPRSWHREHDGAMCLYGEGGDEALPWLDPDDFLRVIARWFDESQVGWPGDRPVLDLDRYLPPSDDPRLVLFGELTDLTYIHLKEDKSTLTVVGPANRAARRRNDRSKVNGRHATGFVVDIGEPILPPTSWAEILELLDEAAANRLAAAIAGRNIRYALVRYRRGEGDGLVALQVQPGKDGAVVARTLNASSCLSADLTLRAGEQQRALHDAQVLVVGAGALGSHICDTIARAGVGHLTVRDHAIVEPGNLVRHLATDRYVGWPKADAVAHIISSRSFNKTAVTVDRNRLSNPRELPDLLGMFDLVIDASAEGATTAMLTEAAIVLDRRFISACLKENGSIVRIDVIPPITGEPLSPTTPSPEGSVAVGQQTGCGDPVSLTPHLAVAEAAALAARHAVGLLTGSPISPAGVVHDYR